AVTPSGSRTLGAPPSWRPGGSPSRVERAAGAGFVNDRILLPSAQEGRASARPQRCGSALKHATERTPHYSDVARSRAPSGALRARGSAALLRAGRGEGGFLHKPDGAAPPRDPQRKTLSRRPRAWYRPRWGYVSVWDDRGAGPPGIAMSS